MGINKDIRKSLVYCDNKECKKKILSMRPSREGLFPHEVAMLYYVNMGDFSTQKRNYPDIWTHTILVDSPEDLFRSMISRGYLQECSNDELVDYLKMDEIRTVLKKKGVKGGNKKEKAKVLLKNNFSGDEIYEILKIRYYVLTKKGRMVLENHPEIENNIHIIWDIFHCDPNQNYLHDSDIGFLDCSKIQVYLNSCSESGCIVINNTEKRFYECFELTFEDEKDISVFWDGKEIINLNRIVMLYWLKDNQVIISGNKIDEEYKRLSCFDLKSGRMICSDEVKNIDWRNRDIPDDDSSNFDAWSIYDKKKTFSKNNIIYYFSANDPISESIVIEYISRFSKVKRIKPLLKNDKSSNYCVKVPKNNISIRRLIMTMIIENRLRTPQIMGRDISDVVYRFRLNNKRITCKSLQIVFDYGKNQSNDDNIVAGLLEKRYGRNVDNMMQAFLAVFPLEILLSKSYYSYGLEDVITRKNSDYDYYYSHRSECKKEFSKILISLQEEGVIKSRWINEFNLFLIVKSYFPEAIFQYRSDWLGMQSLDIYIPEIATAIEYQGKQHYNPVEFFGGEDSLEEIKERDERKRKLCVDNRIRLLEWKYTLKVSDRNLRDYFEQEGILIPRRSNIPKLL